jgi:hypothetical protein
MSINRMSRHLGSFPFLPLLGFGAFLGVSKAFMVDALFGTALTTVLVVTVSAVVVAADGRRSRRLNDAGTNRLEASSAWRRSSAPPARPDRRVTR